jgi:hypothetical protein
LTELGARLWQLEIPDSEQAMRVAARIIAAEVTEPVRVAPRTRRRQRTLAIALTTGLLVALAFTPPGRAVTGKLAELVGIGEVGGPPTESSQVGSFEPGSNEVVLATGASADGVPLEIVAYRSEKQIPDTEGSTVCVNTEFLRGPNEGSGQCYAGALRYGAVCCTQVVIEDPATAVPFAEGQVNPRVDRVAIAYRTQSGDTRTVDATVGMITPAVAETLDVEHPSGLFFASLPELGTTDPPGPGPDRPTASVEVMTFDEAGEPLETEIRG